ncbi:zinc ribbon domain-containing protein [Pseudomonas nitroreducens]|uniref:zinc ribbon domain-containing protein n=1 Tax=Pseudomonas nitroreducens TaxID=46680 RepID=UPI001FB6EC21|nr:zinc ribbon domain-containing protein [Pseudomonas nitroreducens]MCJ1881135.1 zinc ribbon domain-containing protein [Pseudomonas nitroreducens]MCJ1895805.1 zinc ribbon domain-containing protein [Pseudomonas nitroreducens]
MRKFGIVAIVVGIIVIISALGMDVSVATGMGGRVNNLGLMADRQNYTILGGLFVMAGILMAIFGGKSQSNVATSGAASAGERQCPFCAETIKAQAIKCKHCGSEVDPIQSDLAKAEERKYEHRLYNKEGLVLHWVVSLPYRSHKEHAKVKEGLVLTGIPVHSEIGSSLKVGPYSSKDEAARILRKLMQNSMHGNIEEFWVAPDMNVGCDTSA